LRRAKALDAIINYQKGTLFPIRPLSDDVEAAIGRPVVANDQPPVAMALPTE
jgi:hypothetical protein